MPRGVRKDKSERLNEELQNVIIALEKNKEEGKKLESRKKELEQEIKALAMAGIIDVIEQSGLSPKELQDAIEAYKGQVANEQNIA